MKSSFPFLLLLVVFLNSCSTSSETAFNRIELKGHAIRIEKPEQGMYPLFRVGDIVLSYHNYDDRSYYGSVIKDSTLSEPELLFRRGNGHNEFSHIVFGKKNDNALLLMDGYTPTSLTVVPITDNLENIKDQALWKKYDFKKHDMLDLRSKKYYSISDSTLLVIGASQKRRGNILSVFDYKNDIITPLDFWPDDGIKIDSMVKRNVYTTYAMVFGNGKGSYLYMHGRKRYAFIFTINGTKVDVVKNLYTEYPDYCRRGIGDYKIKNNVPDALNIETDNKYIFVLLKEFDKNGEEAEAWAPGNYGNVVEIFDWNGNKLNEIQLDHYGQRIMLSEDGKILSLLIDDYSGNDIRREIWEYNLKSVVK